MAKIRQYSFDLAKRALRKRLKNDGRQTPYKGAIFKAMHATATCCRKCMNKWHKIPLNKELNDHEIIFASELIMQWIIRQINQKEYK